MSPTEDLTPMEILRLAETLSEAPRPGSARDATTARDDDADREDGEAAEGPTREAESEPRRATDDRPARDSAE
jgi:hypothetical protein